MSADYVFPAVWVRLDKYCEDTGEPLRTVQERIATGQWAAGKHYKRLSQRILMINLPEVTEWINRQSHVEALAPSGLKSVRGRVATG